MERSPFAPSAIALRTLKYSPSARNAVRMFVVNAICQGCSKNATHAKNLSVVPLCTHYRSVSLASINLNSL
jgi:hypothetical protein